MNNSYTDYKAIIERIKRDGFEDINETDVKEYIWDVISLLGTPKMFETKYDQIEVEDYRGILPVDFYSLESIRDKDTKIVYRSSTDTFHRLNKQTSSGTITNTYSSTGMTNDGIDPSLSTSFVEKTPDQTLPSDYTYTMQKGVVFIPFEVATLEIVYKAFPIFEDNTPKIPDHPKIIRLVTDYIKVKIGMRYRLQGRMDDRMLNRLEQEYAFSAAAARSASLMNSPEEMENFKNRMIDILPKPNSFRQGHKYLGEETL